ncbi:MAG: cadmium-translocating P-type ATPase [Rhodospirillales bacterium]|nr:cadmium-translocating P-type ATPase [Rhodospirillales bacterium]
MTARVIKHDQQHLFTAGCCPLSGLVETATETAVRPAFAADWARETADPSAFVKRRDAGGQSLSLMVENLSCAACIVKIERAVLALPGVSKARLNMSTRRMVVEWQGSAGLGLDIVETVTGLGYPVAPYNPEILRKHDDKAHKQLLAAMAVAGFAASNVMLLSVAIWSGAFSDMTDLTRTLFHWVSALIALPAIAFAGQPFFRSAFRALRRGGVNMDVPISLAVLMAAGMSLYQTMHGGAHAYFDASVGLLFFLLIGRYLDARARAQARTTAEHLITLNALAATITDNQGQTRSIPMDQLKPGMQLVVASGQRIAADGVITSGRSEIDCGLLTGETMPVDAAVGDRVYAGTLNLGNPLGVRVEAVAADTLLGEIVRLVEMAEQGRAKYVRIADRAARIYVPVVHVIAAATFIGWMWFNGGLWEPALMAAVAVLIITCPCALALAVPVVQVVATGTLLRRGVVVKSADGLERLAECDYVVFDKTGTLTSGKIALTPSAACSEADLQTAAALAGHSQHPLCRALVRAADGFELPLASDVREVQGRGLVAIVDGKSVRLGRADWVCPTEGPVPPGAADDCLETWLSIDGAVPVRFVFSDQLRSDARQVIAALQAQNIRVELISGDRETPTRAIAQAVGIGQWTAGALPAQKVARIRHLASLGHRVLMVGDGLNDAPALASGHASLSPATAADISQTAADFLFQGEPLRPLIGTIEIARRARRIVWQNFALAIAYNFCAVPLAVAGLATPLIAAIAMSSSSLLVTMNALRLKYHRQQD